MRALQIWQTSLKATCIFNKEIIKFPEKRSTKMTMASDYSAQIPQDNRSPEILRGSCLCSPKLSIKHASRIQILEAFKESENFSRNPLLESHQRQKWDVGNMGPNTKSRKVPGEQLCQVWKQQLKSTQQEEKGIWQRYLWAKHKEMFNIANRVF